MAITQYSMADLGKRQIASNRQNNDELEIPTTKVDLSDSKVRWDNGNETQPEWDENNNTELTKDKTVVSTPVGSEDTSLKTIYTQPKNVIPLNPIQPTNDRQKVTTQHTHRIPTMNPNGIPHDGYWQHAMRNQILWGGYDDVVAKMAAQEWRPQEDVVQTVGGAGDKNGRVSSTLLKQDENSIKELAKWYFDKKISQENFEAQWREKAEAYIDHGGDLRTLLSPTGLAGEMMNEHDNNVANTNANIELGSKQVFDGNLSQADFEKAVETSVGSNESERARMDALSGKAGGVSNLNGYKLWTSGAMQKPMTAEAVAAYYQKLFKEWSETDQWKQRMAQLDPMGDHLMKLATDAANTLGENEKVRMQYQAMSPEEKAAAERELVNYFNALKNIQSTGGVRTWSTDKRNKFNETLDKLQKGIDAVFDPKTNDKGKAIGDAASEIHAYWNNNNTDLPNDIGAVLQAINDAHNAYWDTMMLQGSQNPRFLAALAKQVYDRNKSLIDLKGINGEASPYKHAEWVDFDVDKAMEKFEANKMIMNPPDYVRISAMAPESEGLKVGNRNQRKTSKSAIMRDENGRIIRSKQSSIK